MKFESGSSKPRSAMKESLRGKSHDERKEMATNYRELLANQQQLLGFLYRDVTKVLHENPDIPSIDLNDLLEERMDLISLNNEQREFVRSVAVEFSYRRDAIRQMRSRYPDDRALYSALFNKVPEGELEIIATPVMIFVRCWNFADYAYAYSGGTVLDAAEINGTGGALLTDHERGPLASAIALENLSPEHHMKFRQAPQLRTRTTSFEPIDNLHPASRRIAIHEEQHSIHHLFDHTAPLRSFSREKSTDMDQRLLREGRRWRAGVADAGARTEMLAYFSDGSSKETVEELLLSEKKGPTVYKYLNEKTLKQLEYDLRKYLWLNGDQKTRIGPMSAITSEDVADTVRQVVAEYPSDVHRALEALYKLEGVYTADIITSHLIHEPIQRWPRVVRDLLRHIVARA